VGWGQYMFQTFIASSVLNLGGCIMSSPWDVIRAQQINNLVRIGEVGEVGGAGGVKTTVRSVMKDIIHVGGVSGFYRGFGNYMVAFGLRFPLTVIIAELMKNKL